MARKHKTTGLAAWIEANICPSSPLRIKISRYPPIADRLVDLVARLAANDTQLEIANRQAMPGQRGASSLGRGDRAGCFAQFLARRKGLRALG